MHRSRKRLLESHSELPKIESPAVFPGKTAVMGILDRDTRQVRAKVVPNVRRETFQNEILKNVTPGSTVYTDQAIAYDALKQRVHPRNGEPCRPMSKAACIRMDLRTSGLSQTDASRHLRCS